MKRTEIGKIKIEEPSGDIDERLGRIYELLKEIQRALERDLSEIGLE